MRRFPFEHLFLVLVIAVIATAAAWCKWYNRYHNLAFRPDFMTYVLHV